MTSSKWPNPYPHPTRPPQNTNHPANTNSTRPSPASTSSNSSMAAIPQVLSIKHPSSNRIPNGPNKTPPLPSSNNSPKLSNNRYLSTRGQGKDIPSSRKANPPNTSKGSMATSSCKWVLKIGDPSLTWTAKAYFYRNHSISSNNSKNHPRDKAATNKHFMSHRMYSMNSQAQVCNSKVATKRSMLMAPNKGPTHTTNKLIAQSPYNTKITSIGPNPTLSHSHPSISIRLHNSKCRLCRIRMSTSCNLKLKRKLRDSHDKRIGMALPPTSKPSKPSKYSDRPMVASNKTKTRWHKPSWTHRLNGRGKAHRSCCRMIFSFLIAKRNLMPPSRNLWSPCSEMKSCLLATKYPKIYPQGMFNWVSKTKVAKFSTYLRISKFLKK